MLLERIRAQNDILYPQRPTRINRLWKQRIQHHHRRIQLLQNRHTPLINRHELLPRPRHDSPRQDGPIRLAGGVKAHPVQIKRVAGIEVVLLLQGLSHGEAWDGMEGGLSSRRGGCVGEEVDGTGVELRDGIVEGGEGGDVDVVGGSKEEFMGDGQAERGLAQFAVGEEEDGLLVHLRC